MIMGTGVHLIPFSVISDGIGRLGRSFLERHYTVAEREIAAVEGDQVRFYSGRLAAKIACRKALGPLTGGQPVWTEYEINRDPVGRPLLVLSGEALRWARNHSGRTGEYIGHVSISHDGDHAMAFVIIEHL